MPSLDSPKHYRGSGRITTRHVKFFILGVMSLGLIFYVTNISNRHDPLSIVTTMLVSSHKHQQETYTKPLPEFIEKRSKIGALLEQEGMKVGAELGVQEGLFAKETLEQWTSCKTYYLIDLWRNFPSENNYDDLANVDDASQSNNYWATRDNLKDFSGRTKLHFISMFTVEAADLIPDGSLDYVYVDARHDYCGVMEDLVAYWPKLRDGGIMAGHDYVYAKDAFEQDWTLCADGSRNPGAVKGAVLDFVAKNDLKVDYVGKDEQPSWIIRKPNYKGVAASS